MLRRNYLICLTLFAFATPGLAEHNYYKHVRHPTKPVPGVGRNKVVQEGGPQAVGYKRRVVQWWPRKGQDITDIPQGVPLREWTRNVGQENAEAKAGFTRAWPYSLPEKFRAHLVAFRGYGTSTVNPDPRHNFVPIPIAVLRLEDGRQRGVHNAPWIGTMVSEEDHEFIHKKWEEAFPKLYATTTRSEALRHKGGAPGGFLADFPMERWTGASPKFNAMELPKDSKYPRWGRKGYVLGFDTPHFHIIAQPRIWGGPWTTPGNWINPDNPERESNYRKNALENVENMWTYVEAAGGSMMYWRSPGPNYKFIIHSHRNRAAGGSMHCGVSDVSPVGLGHEFFHSMPAGGWDGSFYETWCNAGQHTTIPGEIQMFPGNFCFNWRNVNRLYYQSSFWAFVLADNPNWGHGAPVSIASLAGSTEPTPYHTVARLGEKKGLWEHGVKGWGDWFGEYAARMVTVDAIEQYIIGSRYGMPELSAVYPVYGRGNTYRISNAEAPRFCGYNIIRLEPDEDAKAITLDFQGMEDPELHSDWRACIVAVDDQWRARYSPLWNRGEMRFELRTSDVHLWLTVSASPSAFPIAGSGPRHGWGHMFLTGNHAPRYPWEVTMTGCRPGAPHRRQGDVGTFDDLYGISNYGNKFLDLPIKREMPIPLDEKYGKLAQEKLPAMRQRIQAAIDATNEKIKAGIYQEKGWWVMRKMGILSDMASRAEFLQTQAKGSRHGNGGGFVAESARVAKSAYVGPNAMVLDGAQVKNNACIKGFAVVLGPQTIISGNAKVDGRCWVFGDVEVGGNARILEAATVTTIRRTRYGRQEGQAEISGNAVIKGDPNVWLTGKGLTVTGGAVVDYTSDVVGGTGVCGQGRFCSPPGRHATSLSGGADAGQLCANWQFNQPKATLLEDSYVCNNGILYGRPEFSDDGGHKCIRFNGKTQYAEAPPSVADFGELTIDILLKREGEGGRLFDFGTGDDDCFYLELAAGGKPTLIARHQGKTYEVAASEGIPADKWVRLRMAMDGVKASIYLDGKQVADKSFQFAPRSVFIADRPEGNFIGSSRAGDDFFTGQMDHFRIYRTVHDDFEAVGDPPAAITQKQEWSEEDQKRHDAWAALRRETETKLREGEHAKIQEEIRRLHQQKSALYKTEKLARLEADVGKADQARQALEKKESFSDKDREGKEYKAAEAACVDARKAVEEENSRLREEKAGEAAKLDARIQVLQDKASELWNAGLKEAGVFGPNPYPGKSAGDLRKFQQDIVWHTRADCDYRIGPERDGEIPDKMRKWLDSVRGY